MSAFRLAGLLRFRKLQEEQAAADLAVANAARRRAQAASETADGALRQHDFSTGDGTPASTAAWRSAVATRVALRSMAAEANVAVQVAATDAKQRELAWSDARTRSVSLEKLEEKHVERALVEDLHTEQVALDEIAGRGPADRTPGGGA